MRRPRKTILAELAVVLALALVAGVIGPASAQEKEKGKKPNILFIMGDDVGWFNIGAYHRGIMSGKTPNLDKLAAEGMMFTDYYAEASCTAGRANTGELPFAQILQGQAGATGMPVRRHLAVPKSGLPPVSSQNHLGT
jgi:arylsulfatase